MNATGLCRIIRPHCLFSIIGNIIILGILDFCSSEFPSLCRIRSGCCIPVVRRGQDQGAVTYPRSYFEKNLMMIKLNKVIAGQI